MCLSDGSDWLGVHASVCQNWVCACTQVFFAATGVSDGDLLKGVRYFSGGASTNSIVMRASSGTGALHPPPARLFD